MLGSWLGFVFNNSRSNSEFHTIGRLLQQDFKLRALGDLLDTADLWNKQMTLDNGWLLPMRLE